jgi:hypothetical protein
MFALLRRFQHPHLLSAVLSGYSSVQSGCAYYVRWRAHALFAAAGCAVRCCASVGGVTGCN